MFAHLGLDLLTCDMKTNSISVLLCPRPLLSYLILRICLWTNTVLIWQTGNLSLSEEVGFKLRSKAPNSRISKAPSNSKMLSGYITLRTNQATVVKTIGSLVISKRLRRTTYPAGKHGFSLEESLLVLLHVLYYSWCLDFKPKCSRQREANIKFLSSKWHFLKLKLWELGIWQVLWARWKINAWNWMPLGESQACQTQVIGHLLVLLLKGTPLLLTWSKE